MRYLKRFLLMLLVMPLVMCYSMAGLNYSGFCIKEKRWVTDEEKIQSAIDYVLEDYNHAVNVTARNQLINKIRAERAAMLQKHTHINQETLSTVEFERIVNQSIAIPYVDRNDFMRKNPQCCRLQSEMGGEGRSLTTMDKIFGNFSTSVAVRYQLIYKDENEIQQTKIITYHIPITNCGHAWSGD